MALISIPTIVYTLLTPTETCTTSYGVELRFVPESTPPPYLCYDCDHNSLCESWCEQMGFCIGVDHLPMYTLHSKLFCKEENISKYDFCIPYLQHTIGTNPFIADDLLSAQLLFLALPLTLFQVEDTCILNTLVNKLRRSHDFEILFEMTNQSPISHDIGILGTIFSIKHLLLN